MMKDAIIFILDANVTMDTPYPPSSPNNGDGCSNSDSSPYYATTRLDQAKDAALDTIIDRMWKSKTNEAGVIILKAGMTHHHLSPHERIINDDIDISKFFVRCAGGVAKALKKYNNHGSGLEENSNEVFPNLVEYELKTPCPQTLRSLRNVQCTINESMISSTQGDLCDGLILAADALHRRTNGKKYKRTIVLVTDAEHEVQVNGEQLQCVLDGLIRMEVELIVLGIGFENVGSGVPVKSENLDDDNLDTKPEAITTPVVTIKEEEGNSDDVLDKKPDAITPAVPIKQEEGNPDDIIEDGNSMEEDFNMIIKRENEKLLQSITKATGGCILSATGANLTELLLSKLPPTSQTTQSVGKKILFRIAPNISLVVKSSKLTAEQHLPTTVKEAYQFDTETGEKLRDGNGELMTLPTRTQTDHYDEEGNAVSLGKYMIDRTDEAMCNHITQCMHCISPKDKRTDAFRYGSDLIPVGKMDMLGINAAFADPGSIEMIGYLDRKVVESSNLLMGPAYAFTGGESKKSRTAVAALSLAMEESGMVGFCRIVRTKNGEPKIGALLPRQHAGGCADSIGWYLAFLELPFADDLHHDFGRPIPPGYHGDATDEKICDELIDSMMLPDNDFISEDISNPALKANRRMVAYFAINPMSEEDEVNPEGLAKETIVAASQAKPLCDFDVVRTISKKASRSITAFLDNFPLMEHKPEDAKKRKFWGDGIN